MIPKWKTKKLTILMIPEANRNVRRFQVPVAGLYFLWLSIAGIIVTLVVIASMQGSIMKENIALKAERQAEQAAYKQTVAGKEREISALQKEVVRLSLEAEGFAERMEELILLERELSSLTDKGGTGKPIADARLKQPNSSVTVLSATTTTAVGGQFIPVDTAEMLGLSKSTRSSLESMTVEADRLEASLNAALVEAEKLAYLRSITPSIHPTESTTITSSFGYRRDPFTRKLASHKGIDFGGEIGDPIFATAAGKVSRAGYDKAMGNHVFIKHGNGLETVYMHLSKLLVKKGQNVKKGEKIGTLGSTGRSTGPHLHYEVHKDGTPINPKSYLKY